jgi:hypothetical protein
MHYTPKTHFIKGNNGRIGGVFGCKSSKSAAFGALRAIAG